jgi:hypothetical protein
MRLGSPFGTTDERVIFRSYARQSVGCLGPPSGDGSYGQLA